MTKTFDPYYDRTDKAIADALEASLPASGVSYTMSDMLKAEAVKRLRNLIAQAAGAKEEPRHD